MMDREWHDDQAQYLVKCADGLDYCRVEPWEGGLASAKAGAKRIGGYVMMLDSDLCVIHGLAPVADFRGA